MSTSGTTKTKSPKSSKKVTKKKVTRKKAVKKKVAKKKATSKKVVKVAEVEVVPEEESLEQVYLRKLAAVEQREREIELQEGLPFLYGWKWYKWAKAFFDSKAKLNFLVAANQISKAQPLGALIPTPVGYTSIKDLEVGDEVFSSSGEVQKIVGFPWSGYDTFYKVTFDDDSSLVVSKDHEWVCKTYKERFRKSYTNNFPRHKDRGKKFANPDIGVWKNLTTLEIIKAGGYKPEAINNGRRVSIPICEPVRYPEKDLFDPYLVGLLIGDGGMTGRSVVLTSGDKPIQDYVLKKYSAVPTGKYGFRLNGLQPKMRELGLMGKGSLDKFIPEQYLQSSVEQRMELLKGLMDSDGTINTKSATSFTTISPKIRDGFMELVSSLGCKVKYKTRKTTHKDAYHISFKTLNNPFKLERKRERFYKTRYKHERVIHKIESLGNIKGRCISVSGKDGTYLASSSYIVTHNSSTQIRKALDWATNQEKWPELWPALPPGQVPNQFWYLYPSGKQALAEFETKWPQFLPQGKFKDDPVYGWKPKYKHGDIYSIEFHSGVTIYFKTYKQNVQLLQSGTVYAIFADEELPVDLYDELIFRITAVDGYFHMVFTATLGQDLWRRTMCPGPREKEHLPDAFKQTVSMMDCMTYLDGTKSHWTASRIRQAIARCKSQKEVDKRIHGKFIMDVGLKYPQFDPAKHMVEWHPIPNTWKIYVGIDTGSGGKQNHPSAIVFVGVSPDYKQGRVFLGWRGDGIETTAADTLAQLEIMKSKHNLKPVEQRYDFADKDFFNIASRRGTPVIPADKSHERGEQIINVLFKHDMIKIYATDELLKLSGEMSSLRLDTPKVKAKDDFCDAFRYCVTTIPWDFSAIGEEEELPETPEKPMTEEERNTLERRNMYVGKRKEMERIEDEFSEWNEAYGE